MRFPNDNKIFHTADIAESAKSNAEKLNEHIRKQDWVTLRRGYHWLVGYVCFTITALLWSVLVPLLVFDILRSWLL